MVDKLQTKSDRAFEYCVVDVDEMEGDELRDFAAKIKQLKEQYNGKK